MGCVTNWMYAGFLIFCIFAWPLFLVETTHIAIVITLFVLNSFIAINAWYQCHSSELGFYQGFSLISSRFMSGCANITILYLPFILVGIYFSSLYYSIIGILYGRKESQERWMKLIVKMIDW